MAERDTWQGLRDGFRTDPTFAESVRQNFRESFAKARGEGPVAQSSYLEALAGIADFAIKGTVYIPHYTKQFGDWLVENNPIITGTEEVETQEGDPFLHRGKFPYTIRSSYVDRNQEVVIIAEEVREDGEPRILYPNRLEKFELFYLHSGNILSERDKRWEERMLRHFFPQS